jgi:hypothetical protein
MVHNVELCERQRKIDYIFLRERYCAKYMDPYMIKIFKDGGKDTTKN